MLRVVFMGSPDFAVPTLRALITGFTVVGVFTRPDKPRGRGGQALPTPVKDTAQQLGIPVAEPTDLGSEETLRLLEQWKPDVIVVAAYGKILSEFILRLPRMGCVNLHASLLPRFRGPSPIPAAILDGEAVTGVSTMLMARGLDTGDILLQRTIPIRPDHTAGSLEAELREPGAELVVETLKRMADGSVRPVPQDNAKATYTKLLAKEDGLMDLRGSARFLELQVRAMNPWPVAFVRLGGAALKVWAAAAEAGVEEPGRIAAITAEGIVVGTGEGRLVLREVQASGKKRLAAAEFARGSRLRAGQILQ